MVMVSQSWLTFLVLAPVLTPALMQAYKSHPDETLMSQVDRLLANVENNNTSAICSLFNDLILFNVKFPDPIVSKTISYLQSQLQLKDMKPCSVGKNNDAAEVSERPNDVQIWPFGDVEVTDDELVLAEPMPEKDPFLEDVISSDDSLKKQKVKNSVNDFTQADKPFTEKTKIKIIRYLP